VNGVAKDIAHDRSNDISVVGLVVDDQNPPLACGASRSGGLGRSNQLCASLIATSRERQRDSKPASLAVPVALDTHGSAVKLDQALDDCETQASSAELPP
jgi:hypothetical protein